MPRPANSVKVAVSVHNRRGTGPYPKILEMCAALAEAGAQVTLLCTAPRARWGRKIATERGVRVVEFPDLLWGRLRQGVDLWNAADRLRFLRSETWDVVHAIDCRPAVILPAVSLRKASKCALVISWWDYFGGAGGTARERSGGFYAATAGHIETFFERYFRRFADEATVISTALAKVLAAMGYPHDRIHLIRLGADVGNVRVGDRSANRQSLGLDQHATIAVYAGALLPSDALLLSAALRLIQRDLTVVLVGSAPISAPDNARVKVVQVPRQPQSVVHEYIGASDFCLLPMRTTEANLARWPSKCGDYFAVGRPLVATRVSDFDALFTEWELGYLAANDSAEAFAAEVDKASADVAGRVRHGERARAFAGAELDTAKLGARLLNVYQSAMDRARTIESAAS